MVSVPEWWYRNIPAGLSGAVSVPEWWYHNIPAGSLGAEWARTVVQSSYLLRADAGQVPSLSQLVWGWEGKEKVSQEQPPLE